MPQNKGTMPRWQGGQKPIFMRGPDWHKGNAAAFDTLSEPNAPAESILTRASHGIFGLFAQARSLGAQEPAQWGDRVSPQM